MIWELRVIGPPGAGKMSQWSKESLFEVVEEKVDSNRQDSIDRREHYPENLTKLRHARAALRVGRQGLESWVT